MDGFGGAGAKGSVGVGLARGGGGDVGAVDEKRSFGGDERSGDEREDGNVCGCDSEMGVAPC